jgi:hypothetical protein
VDWDNRELTKQWISKGGCARAREKMTNIQFIRSLSIRLLLPET